jgi:hypothetical protein|tara:strand:+ start:1620 stop:2138 length:519 start_codon:yes stop_codon:yes gene_type:complete
MATQLEFIKSASASDVSSMNVTDCFTDKYDVYAITMDKLEGLQSGNRNIHLRFIDSSSSIISGSEYDWAAQNIRSYASFTTASSENDTEIQRIQIYSSLDKEFGTVLYIFNPNDSSSFTFAQWLSAGLVESSTAGYNIKGIGVHKQAEQITGVNFISNADNFNLKVSVYGVE